MQIANRILPLGPELSGALLRVGTEEGEEGSEEDEATERQRQEERGREQRALDLLGRRIGMEDGSLKRLGKSLPDHAIEPLLHFIYLLC